MAKRRSSNSQPRPRRKVKPRPTAVEPTFDTDKFEHVHQVGGIQTATLDAAPTGGPGTRVAMVNTGCGLRFTVALDRGGDIVEAFHHEHALAYLTPNGYKRPSPAYDQGIEWLTGWPGGLLTSCGPHYFGPPREEDGYTFGLHGRHSNTPASVEMLLNPDPHQGRTEMLLSMVVRDSRMFGPVLELRRQIQCRLGVPQIVLFDQVTNRGNTRVAHNWLYHVNLGYPLVDAGSQLIYRGSMQQVGVAADQQPSVAVLNRAKRIPDCKPEHAGTGEDLYFIDPQTDADGRCHVGLINRKINLGLELEYDKTALPRLANWQHFGPGGSYVTGVEPFSGSLLGKDNDDHPQAAQWLEPGETKRYQLIINVHAGRAAVAAFAKHDGKVTR